MKAIKWIIAATIALFIGQGMGEVPGVYLYACKAQAPIGQCISMWNIYQHGKAFETTMYPPEIVYSEGCRAGLMIKNKKGNYRKICNKEVDRFVKTISSEKEGRLLLGKRYNKTAKLNLTIDFK